MTSILKVDNIQNSSGTSALSIDSSGRMTTPARPAFHAHRTSTLSLTGGNDYQTIIMNAVATNIGSHYSTSTGQVKMPVDVE